LLAESLAQRQHQDRNVELEVLKTLLDEQRRTRRLLAGALLFLGGFLAGAFLIALQIH